MEEKMQQKKRSEKLVAELKYWMKLKEIRSK